MAILGPADLPHVMKVQSDPMKSYVLHKLGHPVTEVELTEDQFETVLRVTGDWIAGYFPREQRLAVFHTQPLKSTYPLPKDGYWVEEVSWDPVTTRLDDIFGAECIDVHTLVSTPEGKRKACELEIGDEILALDADNQLVKTCIEKIKFSGKKECYEIQTIKGCLIASLNHRFRTKVGWMTLSELLVERQELWIVDNGRPNLEPIIEMRGPLIVDTLDLQVQKPHNLITGGIVTHNSFLFNIGNICFASETPIWTARGPIPIEKIKTSDLVHSLNPYSGKLELRPINKLFNNGLADCVEIKTNSGLKALTTPNHRFFTPAGPVRAIDLKKDDLILEIEKPECYRTYKLNQECGRIVSVCKIGKKPIFDLNVPPFHNYVANGALVHNSGIQNILTDYHLLQAYRRFSQQILGTMGTWEVINEVNGESSEQLIRLYPTPKGVFPVVVLYLPFVTHFRSPQAKRLANDMLLAEAKIMLGNARRKIANMPSPTGGTIGLDGDALVTEGEKEREEITKKAIDLGEPAPIIMWSLILFILTTIGSFVNMV